MDQLMDVYVNEEELSDYSGKRKSLANSSESIYENVLIHSRELSKTGPSVSGTGDVKKSSCRAAAVCLGLLCLLLLTALITVACLFTKSDSEWKMEMALLHNNYTNLTQERDQLQTSNTNLTQERDQLQTSYTNLTKERDQLHKGVETMAKQITDLQRKLQRIQDLFQKQGWVYFSGSYYYISSTMNSWQGSRDDCVRRGADLIIINSKEEQEFTSRFQKMMWIGLTDREKEGSWKWVDGTPLTTSFWIPSEPNGNPLRDEDCAEISLRKNWNDDLCSSQKYWICEKTILDK